MNAATPAAIPHPTPVLVRNFCDQEVAKLSASRPHGIIPATVSLKADAGCLHLQISMRADQARSLAIALGILADYADELQTIADEVALQVQP